MSNFAQFQRYRVYHTTGLRLYSSQNIRYKTKTSFLYGLQALSAAFDFSRKQIIILLLLASTVAIIQLGESEQESICGWMDGPILGPQSLKPALVHYVFICERKIRLLHFYMSKLDANLGC